MEAKQKRPRFRGRPGARGSLGHGVGGGRGELLLLEALERLLVRPGLEGEVGLGVEPDAEDDDGEEGGDVAGELPVLPLARLARRRRRAVHRVPLGPHLVAGRRPPAPAVAVPAAKARRRAQPRPQHPSRRRRDRPHRALLVRVCEVEDWRSERERGRRFALGTALRRRGWLGCDAAGSGVSGLYLVSVGLRYEEMGGL